MSVSLDLVQPILLPLDAKKCPLLDVTNAVAHAASAALSQGREGEDAPTWDRWLSGRFTKSVRVAKSRTDFEEAQTDPSATISTSGSVTAVAFTPAAYADMPRYLSRARVTGLHCVGDLPADPDPTAAWNLAVVADMSAGKTAAQVAHAVMMIALETRGVPDFHVYRPVEAPVTFVHEVVDAGLTEFDEPTRTVVTIQIT